MPSSMIHLSVAHLYWPDAPGAFGVGNIAPDFTNDRERKDFIHLRNIPDRWDLLSSLAAQTNPADPFLEGWLLHLFVDACWEENVFHPYSNAHASADGWFATYRSEIGLATYWLFHHEPWAEDIWQRMMAAKLIEQNIPQGPSVDEQVWYRDRVYSKHMENNTEPSSAFPPDMVRVFAEKTAACYRLWRRGA